MKHLRQLHAKVQETQEANQQAAAKFHAAVAQALDDGESPTEIAEALGVTRARVYQWRNRAS